MGEDTERIGGFVFQLSTRTKHASESEIVKARKAKQLAMDIGKSSCQPFIVAGFATAKRPSECTSEREGVSEQDVL
jgi:hypothetical protein